MSVTPSISSFILFQHFETKSGYNSHGLKLTILLKLPPECLELHVHTTGPTASITIISLSNHVTFDGNKQNQRCQSLASAAQVAEHLELGMGRESKGCKKMADKMVMGEITSFLKANLKKTKTHEKNILSTKETTEQEKWSEMS